jgi:hypothetical protein
MQHTILTLTLHDVRECVCGFGGLLWYAIADARHFNERTMLRSEIRKSGGLDIVKRADQTRKKALACLTHMRMSWTNNGPVLPDMRSGQQVQCSCLIYILCICLMMGVRASEEPMTG